MWLSNTRITTTPTVDKIAVHISSSIFPTYVQRAIDVSIERFSDMSIGPQLHINVSTHAVRYPSRYNFLVKCNPFRMQRP